MARAQKIKKDSKLDKLSENLSNLDVEVNAFKRKYSIWSFQTIAILNESGEQHARKQAKKKPHYKPSKMIPRPKGRPGCRNGYSIIEAMGLANHKSKYNHALVSKQFLVWLYIFIFTW